MQLPLNFLLENGLLFEINRTILHPVGLALSVKIDPNIQDGPNEILVLSQTDDSEGFLYSSDDFKSGFARLNRYMKTSGESALTRRQSSLGYIRQTRSDQ